MNGELKELEKLAEVRGLKLVRSKDGSISIKAGTVTKLRTRDMAELQRWLHGVHSVIRTG